MEAKNIVLTRLLPKTGQNVEYRSGDDGAYQAGWWKGLKIANNKTRYSVKTISGEVVVIDHATGLMWAADGNATGCGLGGMYTWNQVIDSINILDFAEFIDWRLPNIIELISIINYSKYNPVIDEPPFSNTYSAAYWTSTTYKDDTTRAWTLSFSTGSTSIAPKTANYRLRAVRMGL